MNSYEFSYSSSLLIRCSRIEHFPFPDLVAFRVLSKVWFVLIRCFFFAMYYNITMYNIHSYIKKSSIRTVLVDDQNLYFEKLFTSKLIFN